MAKNPIDLATTILKPRDDSFNQKMNEYHTKRRELLDNNKYLKPEWDDLKNEMQQFRSGYEKPKLYSAREYFLDNDPDEFQIDLIRDDIDFQGIWDALQNGDDFYDAASVDGEGFDSEVREKIFDAMSNELGLEYDDIYDTWIGEGRPKKRAKTPQGLVNGNTKSLKKAKAAFDNGKISQGQLDDVAVARNEKSKDLLKRYYAGEFDLGTLHDELLKLHDNDIKSAYEWLVANGRRN